MFAQLDAESTATDMMEVELIVRRTVRLGHANACAACACLHALQ